MNFELVAKIVLGSGLFAIFITEILRLIRRFKFKRRIIREIAFEFIFNEGITKKIIIDFQNLINDPCGYLNKNIFKTQVINAVISSSYFVNLDSDFASVIFEFDQRFKNVQYELDKFFTLEDDQKIHPRNLALLEEGESKSKLLSDDLIKSKKLKKLKKKYYKKWIKQRMKRMEERYNRKINRKKRKKIIKHEMENINR